MIKRFLITILFFSLWQVVNAAESKYLFYNINKEVHRITNGKKEKAIRGMFLSADQSIIIAPLAEAMLVQDDGKSMLLNKPGTYTFSQVKKIFSTAKPNGMKGFFTYVFQKFLSEEDDEKQKVSAAVFRGKHAMISPKDSSFIFSLPITLQWKPEQKNIPYKLSIRVNEKLFDTVMRTTFAFSLPHKLINNKPVLIKWTAVPKDSKQPPALPFVYLIPANNDAPVIKQQLKQLVKSCAGNKHLFQLMMNDLLEQWIRQYKLD